MGMMSDLDIQRQEWKESKESLEAARGRIFTYFVGQLLVIDCREDAEKVARIYMLNEEEEPQPQKEGSWGRFTESELAHADEQIDRAKEDGLG